MIATNMKVGDLFEDGGLYYEVQAVLPDGNYISRRTDKKQKSGGRTASKESKNIEK